MSTEKITPEELREIGLEVEGVAPVIPIREPVHACMTCRFRIDGVASSYDLCGARSNRRLVDYRGRVLNPDADCSVWEALPQAIARREEEPVAIAKMDSRQMIVACVKYISIAFIIWAVCG